MRVKLISDCLSLHNLHQFLKESPKVFPSSERPTFGATNYYPLLDKFLSRFDFFAGSS